jgi:formylglycine-generating enzyme required for sulfatase activity
MVWVAAGPLVVGTAPNTYPRRPDRELQGEQVVLHGFYIDKLPYPDEEGAIPTTNVSQIEARELCEKQQKRLCTELEWEHACKGPAQHTFEYGDVYREDICGTGTPVVPRPSGINIGCQSDFGVHDMHGGVFEWTDSVWNRGDTNPNRFAVRGGNRRRGGTLRQCRSKDGGYQSRRRRISLLRWASERRTGADAGRTRTCRDGTKHRSGVD